LLREARIADQVDAFLARNGVGVTAAERALPMLVSEYLTATPEKQWDSVVRSEAIAVADGLYGEQNRPEFEKA
jgi:late competence protein required for DNA uptake (superfamily II DNA/RNA helicase)